MASTDALQRKRLRFLLNLFVVVLGALVVFRLGFWMIIKADWLKEKASAQWIRALPIEPQRGNIEDRYGNILAASVTSNTVVLHPKSIKEEDLEELVDDLHEILGIDKNIIEQKAKKTNYSVVWLDRQITQEQSELINKLGSGGVSLTEDKKRYYPFGNFLTQVLGFTSVDGEGLEGIESRFDNILHGTPGSIVTETDRDGQPLPGTTEEYIDPIEGNNLKLTIDIAIQSYAEKAMELCAEETSAKSVSAIVMNCNTGEILAIVNKPDFDNNEPPRGDIDILRQLTRNESISDAYEPGNLFGLFTVAAAIESGVIDNNYFYECKDNLETGSGEIFCWTNDGHGTQNIEEVFQTGCNLAFADMSLKMGVNTFYDFVFKFGFGEKTGIKLYGESTGNVVSPKYVNSSDLAKIGYGQGISATSIQMSAALSVLVNGGNAVKPYIVKEIISPEGEIIESFGSEITESVISYETSNTMCELLKYSAENGNGVYSQINGYEIGVFAGTAQKYDINGTIIENKHVATFAAAAPIDNPKIIVYIVVDEPGNGLDYGSIAAAPYGRMILEEALPYLSIMANGESGFDTVTMPDIVGMSLENAKSELRSLGLKPIIQGYDGKVAGQVPAAGEQVKQYSSALILLEQTDDQNNELKVEMPDLIGMGSLEANNELVSLGLLIKINGVGSIVTEQYPLSGEKTYVGDIVTVTFGFPPEDVVKEG